MKNRKQKKKNLPIFSDVKYRNEKYSNKNSLESYKENKEIKLEKIKKTKNICSCGKEIKKSSNFIDTEKSPEISVEARNRPTYSYGADRP